jgi:hypothetical protein
VRAIDEIVELAAHFSQRAFDPRVTVRFARKGQPFVRQIESVDGVASNELHRERDVTRNPRAVEASDDVLGRLHGVILRVLTSSTILYRTAWG